MNNPNSGKKVHASFSGGEPAATCFEIPQMVAKAGYTFTGTHSAQPDKWYEIWKAKLLDALFVIVVFSDVYRNRFTKALKKEADAIIELLEQNAIAVYIFDPDAKGSASDIFMNLDEQSLVMGDLSGWVDFVENTIPINLDIPLPPPSSMSSPGYRSPSKRVSSKSPVRKHVGNLHQNSNEFSDNQYFEDEDDEDFVERRRSSSSSSSRGGYKRESSRSPVRRKRESSRSPIRMRSSFEEKRSEHEEGEAFRTSIGSPTRSSNGRVSSKSPVRTRGRPSISSLRVSFEEEEGEEEEEEESNPKSSQDDSEEQDSLKDSEVEGELFPLYLEWRKSANLDDDLDDDNGNSDVEVSHLSSYQTQSFVYHHPSSWSKLMEGEGSQLSSPSSSTCFTASVTNVRKVMNDHLSTQNSQNAMVCFCMPQEVAEYEITCYSGHKHW
eukprot:CAMPEP_0114342444 /NCGR_PEP_ID=MMETSP0101-20121206/9803_1 /TAXON_ID=38822 ORGANISM="Pteridomonas danica, Strain PT" /NCGR_SAMPLE_ID=MMETSP0101 /ASSEMBLY_ACC=CAM_ASM_000211 /LENGTH=437 /DNA_ID=CAMNT_0001476553 /DNA_START=21 /DNA_END=1331 /DNA_ORIENTATION=+